MANPELKKSLGPLGLMALSTLVVCFCATFSQVIAVDLVLDLSPRNMKDYQWMLPTFLMGGCAMMAICGGIMDRYGRVIPYAVGSLCFIIGTAILATTTSMDVFNIARVLQGAGFGAVIVTCMAQVKFMINDHKARYTAHGLLSLGFGLGMLFGIFMGQVGENMFGWRNYMWILLVAQAALTYPCMRFLKPGEKGGQKADIPGAVTLAASVALFIYILQKLYMSHFVLTPTNNLVIALFFLFASLFIFFEIRDPESMARRKLDDRKMMVACLIFIVMLGAIDMAAVGWMVKVSLFVFRLDVLSAGPCFLSVVAGAVVTAVTLSKKIDATGHVPWFVLSALFTFISLGSISFVGIESSVSMLCVHLFLIGLSIGCLVSSLNATIQNRTDNETNAGFVSWSIMARTAGLWLGYNLYQAIADGVIAKGLGPTVDYWSTVLGIDLPCNSSLANILMTPLADVVKLFPGLIDTIGDTYIDGVSTGFFYMSLVFVAVAAATIYLLVRGRKLV